MVFSVCICVSAEDVVSGSLKILLCGVRVCVSATKQNDQIFIIIPF